MDDKQPAEAPTEEEVLISSHFPDTFPQWQAQKFIGGVIPAPRSSHTATTTNQGTSFVVFGGHSATQMCPEAFFVNGKTFQSVAVSSIDQPVLRTGHSAIDIFNRIYLYGGWTGQEYANNGALLDLEARRVLMEDNKGRAVPPARRDHSLTRIGRQMYLFGGWDGQIQFSDVWVLDRQQTWVWAQVDIKGAPPAPRRGHSASRVGGQIWIFGGIYGHARYFNDIHVLDTSSMAWTTPKLKGQPPPPRAWHSATELGDTGLLLIFGGTSGRAKFYNDAYVLDTVKRTWSRIQLPVDGAPSPRCSHSACLIEDKVVIFGGLSATGEGKMSMVKQTNDLWTLATGLDLKWQEEIEEEVVDAVTERVVSEPSIVAETEKLELDKWCAMQFEDKVERRFLTIADNKILLQECLLKEQFQVADATVKVWANRRLESELWDIPDPTDVKALSQLLKYLLRSPSLPEIHSEFMDTCRTLASSENILFYQAVHKFKRSSAEALMKSALDIYTSYLKRGAVFETTVPKESRSAIKKKLRSGTIDNTLFDPVCKELYQELLRNVMPKYAEQMKEKASLNEREQFKLASTITDKHQKEARCRCKNVFSMLSRTGTRILCNYCGGVFCKSCVTRDIMLPPRVYESLSDSKHSTHWLCYACAAQVQEVEHGFSIFALDRRRPLDAATYTEDDLMEWRKALEQAHQFVDHAVHREGWVLKQNPKRKVFRRRYFVLHDNKLYHFQIGKQTPLVLTPDSRVESVAHSETIHLALSNGLPGMDFKYALRIHIPDRPQIKISFDDAQARDGAAQVIKNYIDRLSEGGQATDSSEFAALNMNMQVRNYSENIEKSERIFFVALSMRGEDFLKQAAVKAYNTCATNNSGVSIETKEHGALVTAFRKLNDALKTAKDIAATLKRMEVPFGAGVCVFNVPAGLPKAKKGHSVSRRMSVLTRQASGTNLSRRRSRVKDKGKEALRRTLQRKPSPARKKQNKQKGQENSGHRLSKSISRSISLSKVINNVDDSDDSDDEWKNVDGDTLVSVVFGAHIAMAVAAAANNDVLCSAFVYNSYQEITNNPTVTQNVVFCKFTHTEPTPLSFQSMQIGTGESLENWPSIVTHTLQC